MDGADELLVSATLMPLNYWQMKKHQKMKVYHHKKIQEEDDAITFRYNES